MSDQSAKIYCGNGKVIKTQYGDLMKLSLTAEDVQKLQENLNNNWVNIVVKERREVSPTGLTHYLEIDTWKPKEGSAPAENTSNKSANNTDDDISVEDLPF